MPISGCFFVDRVTQFQTVFYGFGAKVEQFVYFLCDFSIAHADMTAAIRVDVDVDRTCHAYGIADLYEHLIGYACGNHVFCDMAGGVGCRAIHFGRVFSGESTAAVGAFSSIGVNDNFTSCQTGITVRTADDKLAGGVDMIGDLVVKQFENVRILKEVRNSVNRQVNCEAANINKTVTASSRQIDDIILIRDKGGFDHLSEGLEEVARLRIEYPEATLKELGAMLNPPIGKSGVNHRLRKLGEIAEGYRD